MSPRLFVLRPRLHRAGAGPRAAGGGLADRRHHPQRREAGPPRRQAGIEAHLFERDRPLDEPAAALAGTSHLLTSVAPDEAGDPVLDQHLADLERCGPLLWAGYLGTTGVYGDHGGGWVDEATPVAPTMARTRRRVAAEGHWLASGLPVHIFRLAGIYGPGPGRNALEAVRAGTARRIVKPGQTVRPDPRRRHRPGAARLDGAAQSRRDLQPRRRRARAARRTSSPSPASCSASSRRRRSPSTRPSCRRWRRASTATIAGSATRASRRSSAWCCAIPRLSRGAAQHPRAGRAGVRPRRGDRTMRPTPAVLLAAVALVGCEPSGDCGTAPGSAGPARGDDLAERHADRRQRAAAALRGLRLQLRARQPLWPAQRGAQGRGRPAAVRRARRAHPPAVVRPRASPRSLRDDYQASGIIPRALAERRHRAAARARGRLSAATPTSSPAGSPRTSG